jgi:hypothetical protein
MCTVYEVFASDWKHTHRFDDEAAVELYNNESFGSYLSELNGFALGKKWMDVHLAMWSQDIREGNLFKFELYEDGKFPHWWLDNVLKNMVVVTTCLGSNGKDKI